MKRNVTILTVLLLMAAGVMRGQITESSTAPNFVPYNNSTQTSTFQFPNSGFENWDTHSNASSSASIAHVSTQYAAGDYNLVPTFWHTFDEANAHISISVLIWTIDASPASKLNHHHRSDGRNGNYSVGIFCKTMVSIPANGAISTGQTVVNSSTASSGTNYNYGHTGASGYANLGNGTFNYPFTGCPDSLSFWYKTSWSGSAQPIFKVYTYSSATYKDKADGTLEGDSVGSAAHPFNSSQSWKREAWKFKYTATANTDNDYSTLSRPSSMLASFSTNKTAGSGSDNDELFVDDLYCIYDKGLASLTIGGVAQSEMLAYFNSREWLTHQNNPNSGTAEYDYETTVLSTAIPSVVATAKSKLITSITTTNATVENPHATITVTHNDGSTFVYTIHFNIVPPPAYNVYLYEGSGTCGTSFLNGSTVSLPQATAPCDGWSFAGWATAPVNGTQVQPAFVPTTYSPTTDICLYAVYQSAAGMYNSFPTCTYTVLNQTETFENYGVQGASGKTNVRPEGWAVVWQELPTAWMGRPQVDAFAYFSHNSEKSLIMDSVSILAMPELDPAISFNGLKMELYVRQRYASQKLLVGVMSDLADTSTFVPITTINTGSAGVERRVVDFQPYYDMISTANAQVNEGRHIVFWNIYDPDNMDHGQKSFNNIDDIRLYNVDPCGEISEDYAPDFEDYAADDELECWNVVRQEVKMSTPAKRPHIISKASHANSGDKCLYMSVRGMYAMPKIEESIDMNELQMELYVKQPNANHHLEIGLMTNPNDYTTYTAVALLDNPTSAVKRHVVSFNVEGVNDANNLGHYIVFRNTSESGEYSKNYIDDIRFIPYDEEDECMITTNKLPFTMGFEETEGVEAGPAAESGLEPCWTLAHIDITSSMTESMKPTVKSAHNGQCLYMTGRCVYAMPVLAENINVSDLEMTFSLKQYKAYSSLEVGVMSDLTDISTYVKVGETVHNGSTSWNEDVAVDFSTYTGNGKYIVFRNVLEEGYTSSRSYNWIDDIDLHLRPSTNNAPVAATATEEDTEAADNENAETEDLFEVAGPTGVGSFDPENLTIYPNPTAGVLHIGAVEVVRTECFNLMGQLVATFDHERDINLGSLTAGVYTLRVTLPEGVAICKVVKK